MKNKRVLFFLFLVILTTACKKSTDPVAPIESTLSFHGVIQGNTLDVLQVDATLGNGGTATIPTFTHLARTFSATYPNPYGGPQGDSYRIYIQLGGYFSRSVFKGNPADGTAVGVYTPFASDDTFYDLFSVGQKKYLHGSFFDFTPLSQDSALYTGVAVYLTVLKNNGAETWGSQRIYGTPNTNFDITKSKRLTGTNPYTIVFADSLNVKPSVLVEGAFDCWVYNQDASDSVHIENASFTGVFFE